MPDTIYDTRRPAVRANLVRLIIREQRNADAWRALLDVGQDAPAYLAECRAAIAAYTALLADGER